MRTTNLTPFLRATVGFDRMMNLLDAASRYEEEAPGYPPYNIEKTGPDDYLIVMAVAGLGEDDLDVTVKENSLVITGGKNKAAAGTSTPIYRGIATRAFERRFDLADYIRVTGARLENGLLLVALVRELPEAMKPRRIKIDARPAKDRPGDRPGDRKVIDSKAA